MRRSRRLQRARKCVAPGHRARIHAGGSCRLDVADFVADADRICWLRSQPPRDPPKFPLLAEYGSAAVETDDMAGCVPLDLPVRGVAICTHDGLLDAAGF